MTVPSFLKEEAAQMQQILIWMSQLHPVDQFLVILAFVGFGAFVALMFDKLLKLSQRRHDNAAFTREYIRLETEKRSAEAQRNAKNGGDK